MNLASLTGRCSSKNKKLQLVQELQGLEILQDEEK
jgi:hypothetical protein